jgi:hypothetical protein
MDESGGMEAAQSRRFFGIVDEGPDEFRTDVKINC